VARDAEGTSPDDEGRNQHALRVRQYPRRRETRQTIMRDAISMHSEYVVTGGAERRVRPSIVAAFGQTGAGRTLT